MKEELAADGRSDEDKRTAIRADLQAKVKWEGGREGGREGEQERRRNAQNGSILTRPSREMSHSRGARDKGLEKGPKVRIDKEKAHACCSRVSPSLLPSLLPALASGRRCVPRGGHRALPRLPAGHDPDRDGEDAGVGQLGQVRNEQPEGREGGGPGGEGSSSQGGGRKEYLFALWGQRSRDLVFDLPPPLQIFSLHPVLTSFPFRPSLPPSLPPSSLVRPQDYKWSLIQEAIAAAERIDFSEVPSFLLAENPPVWT